MAKVFIQTERMKKDFVEFQTEQEFTEEYMKHMAEELVYFSEYAEKNKIKTMYDLEEKLNLPFEAYLDAFENDCYESSDFDYEVAIDALIKLQETFRDEFFFDVDFYRLMVNLFFKQEEKEKAELIMKSFLEENENSAGCYLELILGFMQLGDKESAKKYYDIAKSKTLDEPELLDALEELF